MSNGFLFMTFLWLFLLSLSHHECVNSFDSLPDSNVTTYYVNFSLPLDQRWTEIARLYKDQIAVVRYVLFQRIPWEVRSMAVQLASLVDYFLADYGTEVKSAASGCGLSTGEMLLLNLAYELSDFCTSIVAKNDKGLISHARSQDFDTSLRNVTIQVIAIRGSGEEIYRSTTFAGFVGIPTGMVKNKFSISLNARATGGNIFENIWTAIVDGGVPATYMARKALEKQLDFDSAVKYLSSQPVISPVYFIMAGVKNNEGVVITRNRLSLADLWFLAPPDVWFVAQTNYDHWLPEPDDDNNRRNTAFALMNKFGKEVMDASVLNQVLLTPPVLNTYTLYTALMTPNSQSLAPNSQSYYSYKRNYKM